MEPKGEFTSLLWESVAPVYQKIVAHPFVQNLAKGTLPPISFAHYLSQDVLYLADDNRALQLLSEKAVNVQEQQFFCQLAADGLEIERVLHTEFLDYFQVEKASEKSEVIKGYTQFLLHHVQHSEYQVAAAALLPCFWIYNKVGKEILKQSVPNNPYKKWIETYEGDEYEQYTANFIRIVDDLGTEANSNLRTDIKNAFLDGAKFELAFFEESFQNR